MALNKDGLEIGKPVDFETMQKILRAKKEGKQNANESTSMREGKEEVQRPDEPADKSVSKPARKKAKKES